MPGAVMPNSFVTLRPSFPGIRPSPDLDWPQRHYELLDSSHILFCSLRNYPEFPLSTSRRIGNIHLTAAECNCQAGLQSKQDSARETTFLQTRAFPCIM
jgi:hypothetical protein